MVDFILRCLWVVGLVLLAVVLLLMAALLLVLFFPVTYRVRGSRTGDKTELSAGMNWLFGLLRVRFQYPEPGVLTAGILWFKLCGEKEGGRRFGFGKRRKSQKGSGAKAEESRPGGSRLEQAEPGGKEAEDQAEPGVSPSEKEPGREKNGTEPRRGVFFEKFKKIKYTICGIYDRIKEIWENISYYAALFREEDTARLWRHVRLRAVNVLKNIRPRHFKADILFGTGAPDTTGYLYGAYCMFSPVLGANALVTPDFERAVLEGRLDLSGHITVFVLAVNIFRLVADKRFQLFVRKLKKENAGQEKAA